MRSVRILAVYVAAALVMAAPFVNYGHLGSAIYDGDTRLIVWTLARGPASC